MNEPLESETIQLVSALNRKVTKRVSERERILRLRSVIQEGTEMPVDHNRPQSGYFDEHPPREAYTASEPPPAEPPTNETTSESTEG